LPQLSVCQVVAVLVVGIQTVKVHLNQLGADMKTRQEMIYDFMVALASNPDVFDFVPADVEGVLDHHQATYFAATYLADEYLKHLG